jgi:hypothetical protein
MRGFFSKIGQFIGGIRRSDDRRKKRWLTIFSGTLMVLIVVLWVVYLNVTLPQIPNIPEENPPAVPAPKTAGPAFFDTLGNGFENVWKSIAENAERVRNTAVEEWLKLKSQMTRTNELNLEKPAN